MDKHYDTIIIGSGLGGLTAGCTLAVAGKKVLLIERHDKVGGFATKFTRKDFTFDVSLHNMGALYDNEILIKIFKELNILEKINYIQFDNYQRIIFPQHDFVIKKGTDNFISYLCDKFPDEKEGIKNLFEIMSAIRDEFDEIENLDVSIDHLEDIYPMLPIKFPYLVKLIYTTFGELMEQHISNEKLKGIVGNLWWIYGMPPEKVASILYSVPSVGYLRYAGGFIEGTSQNLSDAIAGVIKRNDGKIILNTEVKKIIIEEKKVKGIVTENGDFYYSDTVISNASAYETFLELIEDEVYNERTYKKYRKKVGGQDLSLSGLQLYLGLDCDPAELGFNNHNITVFDSYNHNQNYQQILEPDYYKSFYSCTNYTAIDKSLSPDGKGIIAIISLDHIKNWENLSTEEYKKQKQKVSEIIIKKLEKYFPDLSKHIEIMELGTPMTMKRYTRTPEGSIYGPGQIVEQSGVNRLNPKTIFNGLFIVGASIYPGAGYSSVISSAYKAAKMILKN